MCKISINNSLILKMSRKDILENNLKLTISDKYAKTLYNCDNVQSLYLYPLNVIDYIKNLNLQNIIFLNIIDIDENLDYEELFNNNFFKSLKAVEILIKDSYNDNKYKIILKIINLLYMI